MKALDTFDYTDLNIINDLKIKNWKSERENDIEVILLGEEKVGKTQIINQLQYKKFNDNYTKTLSTNKNYKTIKIVEEEKL